MLIRRPATRKPLLAWAGLWLLLQPACLYATAPPLPRDWPLVGEAQLSVLWWDIYQARLFRPEHGHRNHSPWEGQPLLLELTYQRDISADQLLRETESQLQPFSSGEQRRQWLPQLARLWPDVHKGDRLSLFTDAGGAAWFYANGDLLGSISDPAFAPAFLSIWLAPESQFPELARALRGEHSSAHQPHQRPDT
ncbi:chalcone isomerase family protein [Pseudomaricurvus sp. HS19]|uniref:chalcone isomerase family protein n=1 Tax=Pseudomaricurvus sp. HS19 TaxID=2692626 RepID=UPI00136E4F37|nr:chalcone isomerase family protein [Pseudomaricurvus sp. HS19]MYM63486.1 hypothetical protein [Pseudomaricurvus sp. HS19]